MTRQPPSIRLATSADCDAVSAMLARAFANDPAISYIFPDPYVRAARLPGLFRLLFDSDSVDGMCLMVEGAQAATLWRSPNSIVASRMEMAGILWPMLRTFGSGLGRGLRVANAIEAHYPDRQFWYLHIAGVEPVRQGLGLGSALIREGLARRASEGLPAYLETATESNVVLYQSLGFQVTSEWHVPKGGPKFWSMLRPA